MKDIAIYGSGGFGREVACLIDRINKSCDEPEWNLIGFFDDSKETGYPVSHNGNVLGSIEALNDWPSPLNIVIAIGNPQAVRKVAQEITNPLIEFPNVIDPSFSICDAEAFRIGKGNIIQGRQCFASCDVVIGDFNVLNGSVVLGHDVKMGSFNVFMSNVFLSGEVVVGDCNLLGVGAIVLQRVKIGNNVHLSPASVLITNPKDGELYIGNPAQLFKYR
ncbi:MAG: serine acetyltransferase [Muribaculaceae bacterium]|nr:serine acetyltransferase [Muribaculaceae bacterium]